MKRNSLVRSAFLFVLLAFASPPMSGRAANGSHIALPTGDPLWPKIDEADRAYHTCDYESGMARCLEVLAASPSSRLRALALYGLGACQMELVHRRGREDLVAPGRRNLRQALELWPELLNIGLAPNLCFAVVDKDDPGSFGEARREARAYLDQHSNDSGALLYAGITEILLARSNAGDWQAARGFLEKAAVSGSDSQQAFGWLLEAVEATDGKQKACELARTRASQPCAKVLFNEPLHPFLIYVWRLGESERERELRQYIARKPEDGPARLDLMRTLMHGKKNGEAIEVGETALADIERGAIRDYGKPAANTYCRVLYLIGNLKAREKDLQASLDAYRKIEKVSPLYNDLQMNIGMLSAALAKQSLEEGNRDEARRLYEQAKVAYERAIAQNNRGRADTVRPKLQEVEQARKSLAEETPHPNEKDQETAPRKMIGVGFESHRDGLQITSVTPGSPAERAGIEKGMILTRVNGTALGRDSRMAMDLIGSAPDNLETQCLNPKTGMEATFKLTKETLPTVEADQAYRQGDFDKAVAIARELRDRHPEKYSSHHRLVYWEQKRGNGLAIGAEYLELAETDPGKPQYQFALSECYRDDPIKQYRYLSKAFDLDPDSYMLLNGMDALLRKQDNSERRRLELHENWLERNPDRVEARMVCMTMAGLYKALGEAEKLESMVRRAMDMGDLAARCWLCEKLVSERRWQEARDLFDSELDSEQEKTTARWLDSKISPTGASWHEAPPDRPQELYRETFDDNHWENWKITNPSYCRPRNGRIETMEDKESKLSLASPQWTCVNSLECVVEHLSDGNSDLIVFFPSFYVQILGNELFLRTDCNGETSCPVPPNLMPAPGRKVRVKVTQLGEEVKCYLDDRLLLTRAAPPVSKRSVLSFRTLKSAYGIDDVVVFKGIR